MIIDDLLEIADAVSINTGGAGTYVLGDQIDLQMIGRDVGQGRAVYLVITVDTALASATGTIQFKLVSDSTAALATDGTSTEHWASDNFVQADLPAGKVIVVPLPSNFPTYERYVGLLQTTAVAAWTAGKINAFIAFDPIGWKAYPDATN